jgi:hypothetical protein
MFKISSRVKWRKEQKVCGVLKLFLHGTQLFSDQKEVLTWYLEEKAQRELTSCIILNQVLNN